MTDMRARYRGRWARTFAMVFSFWFSWCESLLNHAALESSPSSAIRAAKLRAHRCPGWGIARERCRGYGSGG